MIPLEKIFPGLETFAHRHLFAGVKTPWEPILNLGPALQEILEDPGPGIVRLESQDGLTLHPGRASAAHPEPAIYVRDWVRFEETVYFPALRILIGEGSTLEPTAILKGPLVLGRGCDVRHGAYLRGNVLTGDRCTLGHATEIKNSILMNHTEAGHFNYIGDSILGAHVNLGAGSRLANLQFRTAEEKTQDFIHPIRIPLESGEVETGVPKLGAVVGDHGEVGCNVVLCPGTVLGAHIWVYPNFTVPKGVYDPRQILAPRDPRPRMQRL
ncbi:MAG: hypothetical protein ACE5ER_06905 [Nitrospinaceae bacterium]